MCGGINDVKAQRDDRIATRLALLWNFYSENLTHTRAKHVTSNVPKWLQPLGSRFACLLFFQTAKNRTQWNRLKKVSGSGAFTFAQGDLTFWKFYKISKDLHCFIFQFGGTEPTNASWWQQNWLKLPLCCHYWNTY